MVRTGGLNHRHRQSALGGQQLWKQQRTLLRPVPGVHGQGGPAITDVSVTSRPADGTDTFKAGERIEVTFTFDEAVEVQNAGSNGANVSIRISMGDTNTYVTWSTNFLRMDPPRKLVFGLTVTSSHEDVDGLCISAELWRGHNSAQRCRCHRCGRGRRGGVEELRRGANVLEGRRRHRGPDVRGVRSSARGARRHRGEGVRGEHLRRVTDAQVNAIGSLDLSGEGIGALRKSDFGVSPRCTRSTCRATRWTTCRATCSSLWTPPCARSSSMATRLARCRPACSTASPG